MQFAHEPTVCGGQVLRRAQDERSSGAEYWLQWIPAFAGMTGRPAQIY